MNFAVKNGNKRNIQLYFDKLLFGGDLGNGHYTKEIHIDPIMKPFYVYEHTGYTEDGHLLTLPKE